ncbi:hypothetical protein NKH77_43760 [Streptomyces sp. M19]
MQTAMAQRHVIADLVADAPDALRPRILTIYAELSQMVGWQLYNLGDYRAAQYYYDDARTAAHDAENTELVTYILCTMSQLATWQNKPAWASTTPSPPRRGPARPRATPPVATPPMSPLARSLPLGNMTRPSAHWSKSKLPSMTGAPIPVPLPGGTSTTSPSPGDAGRMRAGPQHPDQALTAARTALPKIDPTNVHNYAHTLALESEAHLQQGNIPEASAA